MSYQGIYKGAGLGLSVVKQFIDDIDGEIYVESQPNKGSIFTCVIPLKEPLLADDSGVENEELDDLSADSGAAPQTLISEETPKKKPAQYRILVVEDNHIAQKVAQSILSQHDCDTDVAKDGKEALELWKKNPYDLIFMDIGLPDMDGYEVTHHIRVQELSQKSHLPIVALTAHAGEENKERCISAGMNAVITKPLTAKNCKDVLDNFIPSRKQKTDDPTNQYISDLPEHESELLDLSSYQTLDLEEGIKATGSEDMLAKMLEIMISESLLEDVEQMKQAHDSGDWEKIQKLAHKIKGGTVYVGAIKIKMACQYLERYWKTNQQELLEPLYQQVIDTINESIKDIKEWLENRPLT